MNNYQHLLSSMDIAAADCGTNNTNSNDYELSISSISSPIKDDDDDKLSLISDFCEDEDEPYSHLPLNKNSKYSLNLSNSSNTHTTLLLNNYKSSVMNNATASTNFSLNSSIAVSPPNSRPNSSVLKTRSKKPHIENIIDNANIINHQLKKESCHSFPIQNSNSFVMTNVASELSTANTANSGIFGNDLDVNSADLNKELLYKFPLLNNFSTNEMSVNSIEYFIQQSINDSISWKEPLVKRSRITTVDPSQSNVLYSDLANRDLDEIIDLLIQNVEKKSIQETSKGKQEDLLPPIYYLHSPALVFSQFMKERVCPNFDKFTIINTISQLDGELKDTFISKEKQHKFVFALLKYNYKLNNDIITIPMKSFVKMSGLKKPILESCELDLIHFLFNI